MGRKDTAAEHATVIASNAMRRCKRQSCGTRDSMTNRSGASRRPAVLRRAVLALCAAFATVPAHAFILEGEALDTAANIIALIVIAIVPIALIVVFWMLHVLPEKIAHRRQHPQTDAIKMLCLLSLVFGGLLWPLAWLWAYSKPVLYKLAYGTDTLEHESAPRLAAGAALEEAPRPTTALAHIGPPAEAEPAARERAVAAEIAHLRASVDRMLNNAGAPKELAAIRDQLAALERPLRKAKVEELH
jgi:hypothetical protein